MCVYGDEMHFLTLEAGCPAVKDLLRRIKMGLLQIRKSVSFLRGHGAPLLREATVEEGGRTEEGRAYWGRG